MITVLLVADDALVRAGVRSILAASDDIKVVAEAADGREAIDLARARRPDVVVLDIRMPVLGGVSTAAELRRTVPKTAVIVLATFFEDEYVARALDCGVIGFLLKSGDPYELMAAVRAVHAGASFLSPKVAHRLIQQIGRSRMIRRLASIEQMGSLSPREREVVALVGAGLSNAEIGQRLHLVEGTVKAYVSSALSRLGVKNRVQAAVVAHEAGLVDDGSN